MFAHKAFFCLTNTVRANGKRIVLTAPLLYFVGKSFQMSVLTLDTINDVGFMWGTTADYINGQLRNFSGDKIIAPVNSMGGDVLEGFGIYSIFAGRNEEVNTKIIGFALSIGSVIAVGGQVRTMPENGFIMIHNATSLVSADAEEMQNAADSLKVMNDRIVATYVKHTNLKEEKIRAMMKKETWLNAQDALDMGFIDSITEGYEIEAKFNKKILNSYSNVPKNLFSNKKVYTMGLLADITNLFSTDQEEEKKTPDDTTADADGGGAEGDHQTGDTDEDLAARISSLEAGQQELVESVRLLATNLKDLPTAMNQLVQGLASDKAAKKAQNKLDQKNGPNAQVPPTTNSEKRVKQFTVKEQK